MDPLLLILGLAGLVALVTLVVVLRRRRALTTGEPAQIETARPASTTTPAPVDGVAARFFAGLARSREALGRSLARVFGGDAPEAEWVSALEEALIGADVGVRTASEIAATLRDKVGPAGGADRARALLREELLARLGETRPLASGPPDGPLVILVVGVNGSGKTTTIGKLAARYRGQGKKVLLAAGDTFRAGAIEQLKVWGERAGAQVIAHQEGADPAAVIFDGIQAARARGCDVIIADTAGRLQAQKALMDELGRVVKVMSKAQLGAPHEVLLVLDATIGQNALSQARVFKEVVGVTGVALTKLDGTARGGVVVAVAREMGVPVKLVGLGEKIDDLRDFEPRRFVDALLADGPSAVDESPRGR